MSESNSIIFFSRDMRIGGMEKALVLLLNSLVGLGYSVVLVLEKKEGVLLEQLDAEIKVKEYPLSKRKNVLFRKAENFFHRLLWSVKNRDKYIFSCNYATYSVIGSRLAEVSSRNSALYVHSDYYDLFAGDKEAIRSFFLMQGISELKHIVFVSRESMEKIKSVLPEYSEKFTVISNLIDHKGIIEASCDAAEIKKIPGEQLLVFVGRLEESSKRITRLLESFKRVREVSDKYRLIIVGDGDDRNLCDSLIKEYGLSECVERFGEMSNPYPVIKAADCVILTSDYEGFPVVYNECLVLRKPLLTTIPVSDDHLDFRDYSVTAAKDAKDIAEAILDRRYCGIKFNDLDIESINKKRLGALTDLIGE